MRYRSGGEWNCGGLVVRTPCSAVGHGGHYHSQSPEALFSHTPGLKVVMPSGCVQAKGLLTKAIQENDPIIFFEPKSLYRTLEQDVPEDLYSLELGKAEVVQKGDSLTVITYGPQVHVAINAINKVLEKRPRVSIELIDIQTIYPLDEETIYESVKKTGRVIVTHEAPITGGIGAEITAKIQKNCFLHLEAPVERVCGYDTPFPLTLEPVYLPNVHKLYESIQNVLDY